MALPINPCLSCKIWPIRSSSLVPSSIFASSSSRATQRNSAFVSSSTKPNPALKNSEFSWKPLCLYHTQGKCTKMDDAIHMQKFNHDCSWGLQRHHVETNKLCPQDLDFFLVLDLEGEVEILEFPVLIVNAKTMEVEDVFHRFVRPAKMSKQINESIGRKYARLGVHHIWHGTAMPFEEVVQEFEAWLVKHKLWMSEHGGKLSGAAFVTCGNWYLETKVPQQCGVSEIHLPPYFMEWINLEDVYLNFYGTRVTGIVAMMSELQIPLWGTQHLGIDDTNNIARVLQRMLAEGALLQITARRNQNSPGNVEFLFENA